MIMNKTRALSVEEKIEIAEQRIAEAKESILYFAEKYATTGDELYIELGKEEKARIDRLTRLIGNALLQKRLN